MRWRVVLVVASVALVVLGVPAPSSARADDPPPVTTELQLRAAWADPLRTRIDLGADIALRDCYRGDPIRESPYPMVLDGHGHTIRQTCFEKRVLRQDGTGWLDVRDVVLTRGGSDGPGAALTSRGEIMLSDCVVKQNLAEEPGGGIFSMRRVTVHRCLINGNLANDDGGGIYARRGGVQVYDSVLSTNLVDGSGGAIGSTGDILVVRTKVDGNTTDGDGGALYADEDGDITVVDSLIDGSDADGPGGAIFTLDGDVAILFHRDAVGGFFGHVWLLKSLSVRFERSREATCAGLGVSRLRSTRTEGGLAYQSPSAAWTSVLTSRRTG